MEQILSGILEQAIAAGAAILLAAMGELMAERTGVLNLGVEGIMSMGAVSAIIAETYLPNPYFALLIAILVGLALGAIYATTVVTCKANQILCGLGMLFLGTGLARWIGAGYSGMPARAPFAAIRIPVLADIPYVGEALFNHTILVYIAYLVLPPLVTFMIYRTRHGMKMRAVGENPAAADVCGVSVNRLRFVYTCVGAAFAAVGGCYLTMSFTPAWSDFTVVGQGWIAIALVIFSSWRPWRVVAGALLFGGVTSLAFVAQVLAWKVPSEFLNMLPYLATLALMIIPVLKMLRSQRRLTTAPAALGLPYERS
jgi:simple sugar transport system permease protein